MSKRMNQLLVKELGEYFGGVNSCVLIRYTGLKAGAASKMRTMLREKQVRLRAVKNSLSRIALREKGFGGLDGLVDGPSAIASGGADPVALAKAVAECAKEKPKDKERIEICGGYYEGRVLTAAEVKALARIPSREVLLTQIVTAIQAPLAGVAGMFASIPRSLVTALKAIADKKEKEQQPQA